MILANVLLVEYLTLILICVNLFVQVIVIDAVEMEQLTVIQVTVILVSDITPLQNFAMLALLDVMIVRQTEHLNVIPINALAVTGGTLPASSVKLVQVIA